MSLGRGRATEKQPGTGSVWSQQSRLLAWVWGWLLVWGASGVSIRAADAPVQFLTVPPVVAVWPGSGEMFLNLEIQGSDTSVYDWQLSREETQWESVLPGSFSRFENLAGNTVVSLQTDPFPQSWYGSWLRLVAINGAGVFPSSPMRIASLGSLPLEAWKEQTVVVSPGRFTSWQTAAPAPVQTAELETRVSPDPGMNQFVFQWRLDPGEGDLALELWLDQTLVRSYRGAGEWREERVLVMPGFSQRLHWRVRSGATVAAGRRAQVDPQGWQAPRYRVVREAVGGGIQLTPEQADYAPGTVVEARATPAAGYEFVDWQAPGISGSVSPLSLTLTDEVVLTARFAPVFADSELSSEGLKFTRGGSVNWHLQTEVIRPGRPVALRSRGGGWIETRVTGPGTVLWWQRLRGDGTLGVELNGVPASGAGPLDEWLPGLLVVPAGEQVVRWSYQNVRDGEAFLDDVAFRPGLTEPRLLRVTADGGRVEVDPDRRAYVRGERVTLTAQPEAGREFTGWAGAAGGFENPLAMDLFEDRSVVAYFARAFEPALLGSAGLEFRRGGGGRWALQDQVRPAGGAFAARSPRLPDNGIGWIETTILTPGTLTYWRKVSSESGRDVLRVTRNGSLMEEVSGESEWTPVSLEIPAEGQVIRWEYRKDSGLVEGMDAAFLAGVVFTPRGFADWPVLGLLPANRRGPEDRNGPLELPNLLAYALGVDPRMAVPADSLQVRSADPATGRLEISFRRSKSAAGVRLAVQGSPNWEPSGWSDLTVWQESREDQGGTEWVLQTVEGSPGNIYWLRLQAVLMTE